LGELSTWPTRCVLFGIQIQSQSGHGTTEDKLIPTEILSFRGKLVESVACGWLHSAVVLFNHKAKLDKQGSSLGHIAKTNHCRSVNSALWEF
jgi:hypothetical protein